MLARRAGWLCLGLWCGCSGGRVVDCPVQAERARALEPVETRCEVKVSVDNPYDPAQLEVEADLEAPDGGVTVMPGFWGADYQRSLDDAGVEQRVPVGGPSWRARLTPTSPGRWRWRWRVLGAEVNEASEWRAMQVAAASAGAHGFVRARGTHLAFDDGAPYFAIGENLAWPDARGTFAYDDWFSKLSANGGTFARVWLASWSFGLEWETLGRYDGRLDRAWALDQVLLSAKRHGISVMLCLQPHGELSKELNSSWARSPYNQANGGPLSTPEQFFTHPEAKRLFEQRLRYVVARWGAFPQVLAFELFNEADLTLQMSPQVQAAWHRQMAGRLKALDPNRHLVTTSLSGLLGPVLGLEEPIFALEDIDLAQLHLYGGAGAQLDFVSALPRAVGALARFHKPVLAAEVGVDFRSAQDTLLRDPTSSGTHDFIWAGAMSGASGTGMSWWWDSLFDPKGLYRELAPVAALFGGASLEGLRPVSLSFGTWPALGLQGDDLVLLWLKNPNDTYYLGVDTTEFQGAAVTVDGVRDGTWRATFVDPRGKASWPSRTVVVTNHQAFVLLPTFSRDLAVRLEHL